MKKLLSMALAICLCFTVAGIPAYAAGGLTISSVKQLNYDTLKVDWNDTASKYTVYRATSKAGTYKKVATVSKSLYSDKKIKQNKTYYYKVKASGKTSAVKSGKIKTTISLAKVPAYAGNPYVAVNSNKPTFSKYEYSKKGFEIYSKLDKYGRCGIAYANVCKATMPTSERGSIGMIKPSGWHTIKYDIVPNKYLYNRCHLVGWQLCGEDGNKRNLITGTRYFNIEGMLPFENMVADYVKETNNHVLYRVAPIYETNDLVARGVQMEAFSVEDKGAGISYNVFVYNVQPGITIDYFSGASHLTKDNTGSNNKPSTDKPSNSNKPTVDKPTSGSGTYVLNTSTKKFHYKTCSSVKQMSAANTAYSSESRSSIIAKGYSPCKRCNP